LHHNSSVFLCYLDTFRLTKTSQGMIADIVPQVAKSPILPLAAAVTAVAIGASPALAAPLSAGKQDEVKVVALPLYAAKGQHLTGLGYHVSHSSHESHSSGIGAHNSHYSHSSHDSHSSSVPAPALSNSAPAAPAAPAASQPAATASQSLGSPAGVTGGSPPAVAPSQSGLVGSPLLSGSGSPAASSSGQGCAFIVVAPFGAASSGIRRLVRRRRSQ
jgi:hypothetical protein